MVVSFFSSFVVCYFHMIKYSTNTNLGGRLIREATNKKHMFWTFCSLIVPLLRNDYFVTKVCHFFTKNDLLLRHLRIVDISLENSFLA